MKHPPPHPYSHLIETGEYWTSRQRQAAPLHEISYRACFKPQLPAYFITRHTVPGDLVYDPFAGRGTTAIEAALHARRVATNDINPLTRILTEPRLELPAPAAIRARLDTLAPLLAAAPNSGSAELAECRWRSELLGRRRETPPKQTAKKNLGAPRNTADSQPSLNLELATPAA